MADVFGPPPSRMSVARDRPSVAGIRRSISATKEPAIYPGIRARTITCEAAEVRKERRSGPCT